MKEKFIFPFSRRKVLKAAGALTVACLGAVLVGVPELGRLPPAILEIARDWEKAQRPWQEFYEDEKNTWLKNVTFGCSFSPEYLTEELGLKISPQKVASYLKFLGIINIRFGLRWNRIEHENGDLYLSYYLPWIQALFKEGINICLNVGPCKTFRFHEYYVPDPVWNSLEDKPDENHPLTKNHPLAKKAYCYLKKLFDKLKIEFSEEQLACIKLLQLDNEAISPLFGERLFPFDREYLWETIRLAHKAFPDAQILINTAGNSRIGDQSYWREVCQAALDLPFQPELTNLKGKIIAGINLYPDHPKGFWLPGLARPLDVRSDLSLRDPDVFPRSGDKKKFDDQKDLNKANVVVSELQGEPWEVKDGNKITLPGNSLAHLQYTLLRAKYFLPDGMPSKIYIWGIEYWIKMLFDDREAGNFTQDHADMIALVRKVNLGL